VRTAAALALLLALPAAARAQQAQPVPEPAPPEVTPAPREPAPAPPEPVPAPVEAPAARPAEPIVQDGLGTRLVDMPTPLTVRPRRLELLFTHRFHVAVADGDEHDLWGLDSPADVGIGLAYGLGSRLDVELLRSSFQEEYELAAKVRLLRQSSRVPLSAALRGGADLLRRPGVVDPDRPFVQLLLARRLAPGWNLLASPSWVSDTARLRDAFNVPLGLTVPFAGGWLIELEAVPENRDLETSVTAWHVAFSKALHGHIWEIVLGNSRATTVDQYLGGDFPPGFAEDDVRLGFNLVRDFDF
jgi:uncharacterized beta barrel domain-containing protein DUF5777